MAGLKKLVLGMLTFLAISIAVIIVFLFHGLREPRYRLLQQADAQAVIDEVHSVRLPSSSPASNNQPSNYTTQIIVGKLSHQDTSWLSDAMPETSSLFYIADDPLAPLHPPVNKGNEAMIYLTSIIEHYDSLPDISIFVHPHRYAWHNNDVLDNDMAEMLQHLNLDKVIREGYMNLRCQWGPGCPRSLSPKDGAVGAKMAKQEQLHIAKVWRDLFPEIEPPESLSGPCCGQFAVSREAIRRLPLERYIEIRQWVLETRLSDYIVGRCFEYLWQFVFTGHTEVCPDQHICHCDAYGICFESADEFQLWFETRTFLIGKVKQLDAWQEDAKQWEKLHINGTWDQLPVSERPTEPLHATGEQIRRDIEAMKQELADRKANALRRGQDPVIRAQMCGL